MTSRIWSKKETQGVIKQLRDAGYLVNKTNGTYKIVDDKTEKTLFRAMAGARGYLVYFSPEIMGDAT